MSHAMFGYPEHFTELKYLEKQSFLRPSVIKK